MPDQGSLNARIGADVSQLLSAFNQAERAQDRIVSGFNSVGAAANTAAGSLNSLSPITSAAAAGVTSLRQAIDPATVSITRLGTSVTQTDRSLVMFNRDMVSNSAVMRGFANAAQLGQLSYVGLNGALTNAGRGVSASMRTLGASTRNTGYIVSNFGRVLSDLPFGFIAIQNNIDPLIASLGGPAGLGLAVTVVGAALTTLSMRYGGLSNALNALNPFIDNATKGLNAMNASMLTSANETAKETANLDLLYRAVKDLNIPLEERRKITDQLIKQYPQTFKGYTAEALAVGEADKAYKELTKTILAKAAIEAGTDAISKQGKQMLELRLQAAKLDEQLKDLQQNGTKPSISAPFGRDVLSVGKEIERVQNKINANTAAQNVLNQQAQAIQDASLKLVKQFGAAVLGIKPDSVKTVQDVFNTLNTELDLANAKTGLLGSTTNSVAKEKISALTTAFDDLIKMGLKPTSPEVQKVVQEINALGGINQKLGVSQKLGVTKHVKDAKDVIAELNQELLKTNALFANSGDSLDKLSSDTIKAYQKALGSLVDINILPGDKLFDALKGRLDALKDVTGPKPKIDIPIQIEPIPPASNANTIAGVFSGLTEDFDIESKKFTAAVNKIIIDNANEGIVSMIEIVGGALVSGDWGNVFSSFINMISGFLSQLGKLLVVQGLAIEGFKNSLKTLQGIPAVVAGAALIAAAGAFKALAGKGVPAFANGAITTGPMAAIVGDNPSGKEAIVPLERFDEIFGTTSGGSVEVTGSVRVAGSDLVIAFNNATKQFGRR